MHGRKGVENRHGALDGSHAAVVPADRKISRSRRQPIAVPARQSHQNLHRRAPRSLWAYWIKVLGVGESSSQVKAKCSAATRSQSSDCPRGRRHRQLKHRAVHAGRERRRTGPPSSAGPPTPPPRRPRSCTSPSTRPLSEGPRAARLTRSREACAVARTPSGQPRRRGRPAAGRRRRRTVARGRGRSPRTARASSEQVGQVPGHLSASTAAASGRSSPARTGAGIRSFESAGRALSERSTGQRPVRGASASSRPYNAWSSKVAQLIWRRPWGRMEGRDTEGGMAHWTDPVRPRFRGTDAPSPGDRVASSVALGPPVMIDLWSCPTERGRPRLSRASQAERARPGAVARTAIGPTWLDSWPFIQAAAEIPQPGAAPPACRGRNLPRRQRSGRPPPRRTGCPGRVVGSTACTCGPSRTSTRRSVPAARGTGWVGPVGPGIPADPTVTAR